MFFVLFCVCLFGSVLSAHANDLVTRFQEEECRILLVENDPNVAKGVMRYVGILKKKDINISLDWTKNAQEAIDLHKEINKKSLFCCLRASPIPFSLILMNLNIPRDSKHNQISSIHGILAAQDLRKFGYRGPICAIISSAEKSPQKLDQKDSLFASYGGMVSSHVELKHMIQTAGQRYAPAPSPIPLFIDEEESKERSGRPPTPIPGDFDPTEEDELEQWREVCYGN